MIERGSFVSFSLDVLRLRQYIAIDMPVFLIIADINRKKGYWVFLQQYANSILDQSWRTRDYGTVNIRIPTINVISDTNRIFIGLNEARKYLASQSLLIGMKYEEEILEALDSRFKVAMSIGKQGKKFDLIPQEPVSIELSFDKFKIGTDEFNNILRGLPMAVTPGSFSVRGSALIESIMHKTASSFGKLAFQIKNKGSIRISRVDSQGKTKIELPFLNCTFEGGMAEVRWQATSTFDLIVMHGIARTEELGKSSFGIDFRAKGWFGQRILNLYLFDQLYELVNDLQNNDHYRVDYLVDGRLNETIFPVKNFIDDMGDYIHYLELINIARQLAAEHGSNPILPVGLDDNLQELLHLTRLLRRGESVELESRITSFSVKVSRSEREHFILAIQSGSEQNLLISGEIKGLFFDCGEIVYQKCFRTFTNLTLSREIESLLMEEPDQDGYFLMTFYTTSETVSSLMREPPDNFEG